MKRNCVERKLPQSADGVVARTLTVPATGWVTARLDGSADGDWDIGVFDAKTGYPVAGGASFGPTEVAEGIALKGEELVVQACRRDAGGSKADITVDSNPIDLSAPAPKISYVRVNTPDRADKELLQGLGLDLAEAGGPDSVGAFLYGAKDAATLQKAGLTYDTEIADVAAQDRRSRAADERAAAVDQPSAIPSGRTTYRKLADYQADMKALVDNNPGLVRPITLANKTGTGRSVEGIEITQNVNARDGKPSFAIMGVHHAREWPAGENTIEFAFDLVQRYNSGDPRTVDLLSRARTVVVPIVNPDGFVTSREAASAQDNGREGNETANLAILAEYQRKNCHLPNDTFNCAGPGNGLQQIGVDPNRNYGALWGGNGASTVPLDQDYRGPAPFSEAESKNIRDLVSHRQVTTLITNHTFSGLVLRPPGVASQGDPYDEVALKRLGDSMTAENGYTSQKGFELYDTTGSTEDWSYLSTGGYGYTFEIGCNTLPRDPTCPDGNFHPSYAKTVGEYDGSAALAQNYGVGKGGNREAYLKALANTADSAEHSVIYGAAPPGAVLRLTKDFTTSTSPVQDASGNEGAVQTFPDHLETVMDVPASGQFEWHVNPSTRPNVAKGSGSPSSGGSPSSPISFSGDGPPTTTPCPDPNGVQNAACQVDRPFTVPSGGDNHKATVKVEWPSPSDDWDLEVYRDVDGNGAINAGDQFAGGQGDAPPETVEQTTFLVSPGQKYVVRTVNYLAVTPGEGFTGTVTFGGSDAYVPPGVETWTLTCETPDGQGVLSSAVLVGRGAAANVNPCATGAAGGGGQGGAGGGAAAKGLQFDVAFGGKKGLSTNGRGVRRLVLGRSFSTKVSFQNPNDFPLTILYTWTARAGRTSAAKRITVVRKRLTLAPHARKTVRIKLTKRGARLLRSRGKLTVKQQIALSGGGQKVTKSGTLALRYNKKKK